MEKKRTSILISILISVLSIAIVGAYCIVFILIPSFWISLIALIVLLGIIFVIGFVLRERIKEIKKGETDDLSKY